MSAATRPKPLTNTKRIEVLEEQIAALKTHVWLARLDALETRVSDLEQKVDGVKAWVLHIDTRLTELLSYTKEVVTLLETK